MILEKCQELGWPVTIDDRRRPFPAPRLDLIGGLRFSQRALLTEALLQDKSGLIGAPTRYGKCFAPGTLIMMADGTTRLVEDIRNGDLIMGHDSLPRLVVGCVAGQDVMYRIIPKKGEPFTVTRDHPLVLRRTRSGRRLTPRKTHGGLSRSPNKDNKEILVTAEEFASSSKTFKHLHKLVKRPVDYPAKEVPVDPCCYGLWLGDGHKMEPSLTTADAITARAWLREARRLGMFWRVSRRPDNKSRTYHLTKRKASQRKGVALYDVSNVARHLMRNPLGKRIHTDYLFNSREVRLGLLAGFIDSDGYTNNKATFAVVGKSELLIKDLQVLARGLGFRATIIPKLRSARAGHSDTYYEVHISGALQDIPTKLHRKQIRGLKHRVNPLVTGLSVECLGRGQFYGFEIDGPDKLFLLGDFTVTHNTPVLLNTCRAYPGLRTVITAPGRDLVRQLAADVKKWLPERRVKVLGGGSSTRYQGDDITVASMDSLHKCDHTGTDLLIADETHAIATDTRIPGINSFTRARRIGLGATLKGRFDQRDLIIQGLIGPVLAERTYREAVAEGAICPIVVVCIALTFDPFYSNWRNHAMERVLWQNPRVAWITRLLCDELLPPDWQTLLFIKNQASAEYYHTALSNCRWPVAMAKLLTGGQRKTLTQEIKDSVHQRVLCSDIYVQGMTFSDLRALINLGGGGPYTSVIQKPGRLAEIRPDLNKKFGLMIDFMPRVSRTSKVPAQAWWGPIKDGENRLRVYHETGYDVRWVHTSNELKALMKELTA